MAESNYPKTIHEAHMVLGCPAYNEQNSPKLHEELPRILDDPFLNEHCPYLAENLAALNHALVAIVRLDSPYRAARLHSKRHLKDAFRILTETLDRLLESEPEELLRVIDKPGYENSVQLTPNRLFHILQNFQRVGEIMLSESTSVRKR